MKTVFLMFSLFFLFGCQSNQVHSSETNIKSKDETSVRVDEKDLWIHEGASVSDVIYYLESVDGSIQTYAGVTNGKTIKTTSTFFRNEYLLVTSESGNVRTYYMIRFFD